MMTLWPSPRTISHTPSQQFIQIPYSRLPTPLTPEEEASIQNSDELTKEDLKATAMASVAIGVAGVAGGVAVISQLLNLQGQGQSQGQNQEQEQEQQQRDDQSHRRRRRLSLGDNSDDSDSDSDGTIVRIRDREQSNASEITLSRSIRNSCTDCSGTRLTLSESFPTHTIC
jgi:hypothetical protein